MTSVEFNQDKDFQRLTKDATNSSFVRFLIKKGFAKDEKQANIILISISVISLITTAVVVYTFVLGGTLPNFGAKKIQNDNAKVIQEFRDQGLKGAELMKKIQEARQAGIIK